MRHNIIEGEPGIFPEPITRFMRKIGELFGAKRKRMDVPPDEPPAEASAAGGGTTAGPTADTASTDPPTGDDQPKP